jgi:polysaccharide export outer membrane protein
MTTTEPNTAIMPARAHRGASPFLLATVCALCLPFISGCASHRITTRNLDGPRTATPAYTLGPGDELRVTVYEHEDLSGTFYVDDAGTLSLPLVGRMSVEGMTLPQVESAVASQLQAHLIVDPKVSVDVDELRPLCVLGEVKNPGCFPYLPGMMANEAIARAGGYTYRAKKNELVITREDGGKMLGNEGTPVFSGDVVQILERRF